MRAGGLCQGAYLKEAIRRYEQIWLPLLSAQRLAGQVRRAAAAAHGRRAATRAHPGSETLGARLKERARGCARCPALVVQGLADVPATPLPCRLPQPWQQLAPPLDVAFVWHLHRLSPSAYAADCQRLPDAQGQVLHMDLENVSASRLLAPWLASRMVGGREGGRGKRGLPGAPAARGRAERPEADR